MAFSALLAVILAVALRASLEPAVSTRRAGEALRLLLLTVLAWSALGWTRASGSTLEVFPPELPPWRALELSGAALLLGAAAFGAARGPRGASLGALFGLLASAVGLCASRWTPLARAIELCGGAFIGPLLGWLLTPALAATQALLAAALLGPSPRPRALALGALAAWAAATFGAEALLSRVWGYGPRSLPEAAGVPSNREASVFHVAWLRPDRARSYRFETRRMSSETTELSPQSLERLRAFLEGSGYRGVFAAEALAALRLGWLQWWDEERALEALSISVPGRAHPDYRRALELIRAGPLNAERFGRLERLAAATGRRVEGFESGPQSQEIFEGFSAAYARFGDEVSARKWLQRIDGLWGVSDKRIEAGSLEDMRDGRIAGSVLLDGRPATGLRVGLFMVWISSGARSTQLWLSGSRAPDEEGAFSFEGLGPGSYVLGLLGPAERLRGALLGVPGFIDVSYERPELLLRPILVEPELGARLEGYPPANPTPRPAPSGREPSLRLRR